MIDFFVMMYVLSFTFILVNVILKCRTKTQLYFKKIFNCIFAIIAVCYVTYMYLSNVQLLYLIILLGAFFVIWGIFRLTAVVLNKNVLEREDNGEIYVRDVESKYSPAVVSYLINQKTELKKDLMATIINLCAKKYLVVSEAGVQPLDKQDEDKNLTKDEKYIYDCILKKEKFSNIKWYTIILENVNELGFFCNGLDITDKVWISTIIILAIIVGIFYFIFGVEMVLAALFAGIIISVLFISRYIVKQTYKVYTKKGAVEVLRWKKLKMFLKDFSLINEAEVKKVALLEKYLSYGMALNINKKYSTRIMKELNIGLNINILDKIKEEVEEAFDELENTYE